MCNSVLGVKRRLLALLLIVGCMAVSVPAFARVCFLPDSKDCGIPGIQEIPETCDGVNTFANEDDCKDKKADGQKCEPVNEGGCFAATCEYADKEACETVANTYCTDNNYYFCEYDSSIGCYVLNKQECSYNNENKCAGYTLDQEEDGKTCCACTRTTCKKCGQTKDVTKYKCIETKYQEVGCDDFDKTKAEADTLKAQNYTCTSCTREKQKQTCDGSWDKYGEGETVYKCDKCTPTKDCADYTYTTLSDTSNATSCDDGCETKWKCNVGYEYDSATQSCKQESCSYTYFEATTRNTCGTTGNLDDNDYSCQLGTCCFIHLSKVQSINMRDGTGSVMPIFNKISNKSNSCVRDGTTYYETLCTGSPKDLCPSGKTFVPNGCVSSAYNHGYEVKGTQWGSCGCDTASGKYDTSSACNNATGKGCTSVNNCFQTCESQGYYSTEADCKSGLPKDYQCLAPGSSKGNSNCYVRYLPGFTIRYASTPNRNWICSQRIGGSDIHQTFRAWLAKVTTASNGSHVPGTFAETIDGNAYSELSDNEHRYEAGTYFVCSSNGDAFSTKVVGIRKTVVQYTRSANGADPTTLVCFADSISSQFSNTECQYSTSWGSGYNCREVTFNEGVLYLVSMYSDYQHPGWTYDMGTCRSY